MSFGLVILVKTLPREASICFLSQLGRVCGWVRKRKLSSLAFEILVIRSTTFKPDYFNTARWPRLMVWFGKQASWPSSSRVVL